MAGKGRSEVSVSSSMPRMIHYFRKIQGEPLTLQYSYFIIMIIEYIHQWSGNNSQQTLHNDNWSDHNWYHIWHPNWTTFCYHWQDKLEPIRYCFDNHENTWILNWCSYRCFAKRSTTFAAIMPPAESPMI